MIIGTRIFQTGVDIPCITHFINARGLKSEIATIQALGRALRTTDEKSTVEVFDFYDNPRYLLKHSQQRLKTYKDQKHTIEIAKEVKW